MPRKISEYFTKKSNSFFTFEEKTRNCSIIQEACEISDEEESSCRNITSPTLKKEKFVENDDSKFEGKAKNHKFIKTEKESQSLIILQPQKVDISIKDFFVPIKLEHVKNEFKDNGTKSGDLIGRKKKSKKSKENISKKVIKPCKEKFNSCKKGRIDVRLSHNNKPGFQCEICDKKFTTKFLHDIHLSQFHPNGQKRPKFECDFDGIVIYERNYLLKHMRKHMLPINCKICNSLLKPFSMDQHIKDVHGTKKKFKCKVCSKGFKIQGQLSRHAKIHDKKLQCDHCGVKYALKAALKLHIMDYHLNPLSFVCKLCDKRFNCKKHLVVHDTKHKKDDAKIKTRNSS